MWPERLALIGCCLGERSGEAEVPLQKNRLAVCPRQAPSFPGWRSWQRQSHALHPSRLAAHSEDEIALIEHRLHVRPSKEFPAGIKFEVRKVS